MLSVNIQNCQYHNKSLFIFLQSSKEDKTVQSLPSDADVVVIGGGSIGCSTLYHLASMGVSNAILLEKDQLTAGNLIEPLMSQGEGGIPYNRPYRDARSAVGI